MNYIDDLDHNITHAEEELAGLELCLKQGWSIGAHVHRNTLESTLKSIRHCLKCARNGQRIANSKHHDNVFKCPGGCVRARGMVDFDNKNRRICYIIGG